MSTFTLFPPCSKCGTHKVGVQSWIYCIKCDANNGYIAPEIIKSRALIYDQASDFIANCLKNNAQMKLPEDKRHSSKRRQ